MFKKVLTVFIFLMIVNPIFSQETDWKEEYKTLLAEYEDTVNTLEDTKNNYADLLISYDTLTSDYENLFDLYT